ncbi:hypothetical protein [Neptuniibacter sp.]|uniref:hypothetical protein n=1 Tax=Neptuniibacter sp. TaxID=1962643 RepID=UPI00260DEA06|nr:hypothetical protein [Neptuniibacter sp.]MCP4597018.1 hypothetical protein [Neptuniibacter sp.]
MKTDKFSDRIDMTTTISLYEYKIIRNPKTDKCIICYNCHALENIGSVVDYDKAVKPDIGVEYISFDDVKEELENVEPGYFDFIGADRQTEIDDLNNDYLTNHIFSLDMYNGAFRLVR